MYGNLDSIDTAYRTRTGQEPLPPDVPDAEPTAEEPLPPDVPDAEPTAEEKPDSSWLKTDIHDWLVDSGVDVPAGATKAELLDLVE